MPKLILDIPDRIIAERLFDEADSYEAMVNFISIFVDYGVGYKRDFRDMVIKRLEADK